MNLKNIKKKLFPTPLSTPGNFLFRNFLLFIFLFFSSPLPPLFSLLSPLPFFFPCDKDVTMWACTQFGALAFSPSPFSFFPLFSSCQRFVFSSTWNFFSLRSLPPFYLVLSLPQALTVLVPFGFWTWKSFSTFQLVWAIVLFFLIFSDSKRTDGSPPPKDQHCF